MRKLLTLLCCIFAVSVFADGKYVGGDISLLPSYLDHIAKEKAKWSASDAGYHDTEGNYIADPLAYFAQQGMNAMRVRLFVDPTHASSSERGEGVVQDLEYVKRLGKMIKDQGMALLLDFHYSDTWADPSKQWTPSSWANLNDEQLYDKIYEYTKNVLQEMKAAGATPDFIQTGNEISYGMLWGKSTDNASSLKKCHPNNDKNWPRFTTLLQRAITACREECPSAKVIIHTERAGQSSVLLDFYKKLKTYSIDYDIIGLSYYSYYHGALSTLNSSLNQLESTFPDKKIMLVEVGYYHDWQPSVTYDLSATYPINGEGQKAFTVDLIDMVNKHANVNGFFWWFMEANEYGLDWTSNRVVDNWYNSGLFDNATGRAEPALYVLRNFLTEGAGIHDATSSPSGDGVIHTLDGRRVKGPWQHLPHGIYIINGKKVTR